MESRFSRCLPAAVVVVAAAAILIGRSAGAAENEGEASPPAGYLPPEGDMATTAVAYGLKPGMNVLLVSVRPGEPVRLSGFVSDPDGPQQPLAVWDFGDATELQYGKTVEHRYARPGTYTVRLRASDSVLERAATVTVKVFESADR